MADSSGSAAAADGERSTWQRVQLGSDRLLARTSGRSWIDLLFVPAVIVALIIYFASVNEFFLESRNLTNITIQASVLAIVSFGVTYVILAGELDLSVGSGVALASVMAAFVMRDTGSVLLGVLVALGVGLAIATFNGLVVTRLEVPSFIATFGMLVIASGLALAATDGGVVSGLPSGISVIATEGFLGLRWMVWITIAVFAVLFFVQTQTAFGVRVFAVGGNRQASRLVGITVDRVRMLTFLISGVTMGIAAFVLTARLEAGQPKGGTLLELDAVTAIVIGGTSIFGGRGSLTRTLFGVLLIAVLINGLSLEGVGDEIRRIIIGCVLIGAASADYVRTRLLPERRERRQAELAAEGAEA